MAYNSRWTGPQIDDTIERVRNSGDVWDAKQDKLKGTVKQILGFDVLGNPTPKNLEDFKIPSQEAMENYADSVGRDVLENAKKYTDKEIGTKDAELTEYVDNSITNSANELKQYVNNAIENIEIPPSSSGLPSGGTAGQILAKKSSADGDVEWIDPSSGEGGGSGLPSSAIQQMIDDSISKIVATDVGFSGVENGLVSDNVGDAINELDNVVADVEQDLSDISTEVNSIKETIKEIQGSASVSAKQYTLKLVSDGWSNKEQTFTIKGISEDESVQLIQPVVAQNDFQVYADCEIRAKQSLNAITFVCEEIPVRDITIFIVIQELKAVTDN